MRKFNQLFACFRKCFENILPFSEIIFVLLQADLHDLNGVQTRQPDLETLIRISDLLKVDVNDLLNKKCIKE